MKSNSFLSIIAGASVLASLCLPVFAQEEGGGGPQVSMRIDFVAWGGADIHGLTLKKGGHGDYVTALAFRYSKPAQYAGSNLLEIFKDPSVKGDDELMELDMEGNVVAKKSAPAPAPPPAPGGATAAVSKEGLLLVAKAVLPTDSKRVTILLAPGQGGLFQAHVIDDDPAKLPMGRLRVHNLSPLNIGLRWNGTGEMKGLKPREAMVVGTQNEQVIYEMAYQKEGQWQMQENNILRVAKDEQAQMIILKSNDNFFTNSDGSRGGFLQAVVLRRTHEM